jgi:hypothetical protein
LKISPERGLAVLLLAGVAAWAFVPAAGQGQDSPESLLPPGFDEPATPAPSPPPSQQQPSRTPDSPSAPAPSGGEPVPDLGPIGNDSGEGEARSVDLSRYELPEFARHSLDRIGAYAWGNPQFPARAFGTNGRFTGALMRRLDAPVASRWVSIALRRALLSRVDTPADVGGADFAADRAWLLIRMGESVAARAVVQDVDTDNYTPWMYQVAMQSALASADPGAMCGFASEGQKLLTARGWGLAKAMCAGLAGKPNEAGQLLSQASGRAGPGNIDNLLAEKVLGTGAQGRRAVTVEWTGVDTLTAWRWGLATAVGEAVPDALYNSAGAQVRFWHALSPGAAPSARVADAELAAAQGVFSNAGLVDLFGEIDESGEGGAALTAARDLRRAYNEPDPANRIAAMKSLWDEPQTDRRKYARLVLTARAAARIAPSSALAGDADRIIASMLTAGFENAAQGWRPFAGRGSDGWLMLEMADPAADARTTVSDFDAYRGSAQRRKAQLAFAGLAGLGRFSDGQAQSLAAALDVEIGAANGWTRAIDAAAARREAGTVALLAAVGMQTRMWERVTPEALFHICAGLRAVGLTPYARMIAVEAVARA